MRALPPTVPSPGTRRGARPPSRQRPAPQRPRRRRSPRAAGSQHRDRLPRRAEPTTGRRRRLCARPRSVGRPGRPHARGSPPPWRRPGPRRPRRRRGRRPPPPAHDAPEPPAERSRLRLPSCPSRSAGRRWAAAPDPPAGPPAIGEHADAPAPAGPPTVPAPTVPRDRAACDGPPCRGGRSRRAASDRPRRAGRRRRRPRASRRSAGAREPVAPQPPQVLIDRIEIDHAAGVAACRRPVCLARAPAGWAPHATEAPADGGRDGDPGCRRHPAEARRRRRGAACRRSPT